MRRWLPVALAFLLAGTGCTDAPPKSPAHDADDGLVATETTGILRGIVVDSAIRPLSGARITIQRPGADALHNVSNAAGNWGFDDLEPGTYAVTGTLDLHVPTQTIAYVRAGDHAPVLVRLLLEADVAAQPYVAAVKMQGFMECGVRGGTGGASCQTLNAAGNITSSRSSIRFPVENGPLWIQGEMVWKPGQPLADQMGFYFVQYEQNAANNHYMGIYPLNMGKSPLLLAVDTEGVGHCATCVEAPLNMTAWAELQVTGMAGEMSSTTPPPTCSPTGSPCLTGVGVVVNQQFDIFLHIFYRTTPPDGWRFSTDGEPPA